MKSTNMDIEKISLYELGTEEIYNDGRPFRTDYSTEKAVKDLVEKINEIVDKLNIIK